VQQYDSDGLCFDDILLVPQPSSVASRQEVSLRMDIGRTKPGILEFPVIAAPMDTVCESDMATAMAQAGGLGIIHRYLSITKQCFEVYQTYEKYGYACGAAVGATGDYLERAEQLVASGAVLILVDTANGHSDYAVNAVKQLRAELGQDIHIMAGNVATSEAFFELSLAGADSIRVGIGGGSACTTRSVTGHGIPTLASVMECKEAREVAEIDGMVLARIIADGGIRTTGDMAKAFAAGADAVMLGSMLAGYEESPGEVVDGKKIFRGMASAEAQNSVGRAAQAEGISTTVPFRGQVADRLREIRLGLASACSYSGVHELAHLSECAQYVRVSAASLAETRPHAKEL
jgi:IMP dehydrogenase